MSWLRRKGNTMAETSKTTKKAAISATNKALEGLEKLRGLAVKLTSAERNEIFQVIDKASRATQEALSNPSAEKKPSFGFRG